MRRALTTLLAAALATSVVAAGPHDADSGAPPLHCNGRSDRAHPIDLEVHGEQAHGLYAVPQTPPDTLVVYAHGYGHSSESWRQHMIDTAHRTGAAAVAMDYRGTRFVGDEDGGGVPSTRGWRVAEGAVDSIAAARAFEQRCRIDRIVLMGVSMGGNASGLALAEQPTGRDGGPLFDWWVQVEGAANVIETYQGARVLAPANTFAANAVEDIEEEMGGTFEEVPEVYAERTVVNRIDDIAGSGVQGAFVVHALEDGLVPYNQARELVAGLRQVGVGTDMHSVGTRDEESEAGTTISGYAGVDSPFTGHASERSTTHLVMRTAFDVLDDLVAGELAPSDAEVLVDGTT